MSKDDKKIENKTISSFFEEWERISLKLSWLSDRLENFQGVEDRISKTIESMVRGQLNSLFPLDELKRLRQDLFDTFKQYIDETTEEKLKSLNTDGRKLLFDLKKNHDSLIERCNHVSSQTIDLKQIKVELDAVRIQTNERVEALMDAILAHNVKKENKTIDEEEKQKCPE